MRTGTFDNKRIVSAGDLIALSTETIVMADGSTIGAATHAQLGAPGPPPQLVAEKTVSFRATNEAMVDAGVEVPSVITKGKLLMLTTEEALRSGLGPDHPSHRWTICPSSVSVLMTVRPGTGWKRRFNWFS